MPVTETTSKEYGLHGLIAATTDSGSQPLEGLGPLAAAIYQATRAGADFVIEAPEQEVTALELLVPAIATLKKRRDATQCWILSSNADRIRAVLELAAGVSAYHNSANGWHGLSVVGLYGETATRSQSEQLAEGPDLIVATPERLIDFQRRDSIDHSGLRLVVIDEPSAASAGSFNADIQFIYSKVQSVPLTCVVTPAFHPELPELELILSRSRRIPISQWQPRISYDRDTQSGADRANYHQQERAVMSRHGSIDETAVKAQVDEILRQILEDEDPEELNAYRKLVKKYVPFSRRGYFTAYLFKYAGSEKPKGRRNSSNGDYTSIFVGIGKNRKVFPKDLIQLFSDVDGVSSEDIGQIKILDNYSFLEITPDKAQPAIDTLNGREFRGRRLTVNFARKKD